MDKTPTYLESFECLNEQFDPDVFQMISLTKSKCPQLSDESSKYTNSETASKIYLKIDQEFKEYIKTLPKNSINDIEFKYENHKKFLSSRVASQMIILKSIALNENRCQLKIAFHDFLWELNTKYAQENPDLIRNITWLLSDYSK